MLFDYTNLKMKAEGLFKEGKIFPSVIQICKYSRQRNIKLVRSSSASNLRSQRGSWPGSLMQWLFSVPCPQGALGGHIFQLYWSCGDTLLLMKHRHMTSFLVCRGWFSPFSMQKG